MTTTFATPHTTETFTGKVFDLRDPGPASICIEDIAHHLSLICRFTGAVRTHLSVAQHSIWVCQSELARNPTDFTAAALALLHDAHEAYIGDWSRPLMEAYPELKPIRKRIIAKLDAAICEAFNLPNEFEWVKASDNAALLAEAATLLPSMGEGWGGLDGGVRRGRAYPPVPELGPRQAERMFLEWWKWVDGWRKRCNPVQKKCNPVSKSRNGGPFLIGIGHAKRHGKDSVARFMIDEFRRREFTAERVSFADKLKDICYTAYQWGGLQPKEYYEIPGNEHEREVILPAIGKTPRQIWIEVGNKLREVHPETWIRAALSDNSAADFIIIPDTRYPNEAASIRESGGFLVKVHRAGLPEANDAADCALADFTGWDAVIANDSTLDELAAESRRLCGNILGALSPGRQSMRRSTS